MQKASFETYFKGQSKLIVEDIQLDDDFDNKSSYVEQSSEAYIPVKVGSSHGTLVVKNIKNGVRLEKNEVYSYVKIFVNDKEVFDKNVKTYEDAIKCLESLKIDMSDNEFLTMIKDVFAK